MAEKWQEFLNLGHGDVFVDYIANRITELVVPPGLRIWEGMEPQGYARLSRWVEDHPVRTEASLATLLSGVDIGLHYAFQLLPANMRPSAGLERFLDDMFGRAAGVIVRYVQDHPPLMPITEDVSDDQLRKDLASFGGVLRERVRGIGRTRQNLIQRIAERPPEGPWSPVIEEINANNAAILGDIMSQITPEERAVIESRLASERDTSTGG